MRKRQYTHRSASDMSVVPANNLLQTRPFQADTEANQQTSKPKEESENPTGRFDLTKTQLSFDQPTSPTIGQPLQAKLTIGEPNDKYEQEADRVAHDVVQRINQPIASQTVVNHDATQAQTSVQRKCEASSKQSWLQAKNSPLALPTAEKFADQMQQGFVQRDIYNAQNKTPNGFESALKQAKSDGQSLRPGLQRKLEGAMGADFGGVRIHTGSSADQLNHSIQAKAFTTGQDIFFRQGAYEPNSKRGQELIAHELTHVVQQNSTVQRKSNENNLPFSQQPITTIDRSSSSAIQRFIWPSDQFDREIVGKVKTNIFSKTAAEATCKLILIDLKEYEKDLIHKTDGANLENRITLVKGLQRRAIKAREETQEGEEQVRASLTSFEASLIGEIRGLEAKKNGEETSDLATDSMDGYFEYAYSRMVYDPVFTAVCYKMGLGRGEWLRSAELNDFRNALKKAGRSQAYSDIDANIESELNQANRDATDATTAFYGDSAKGEAYDTVKTEVVNAIIKDVARGITEHFVPKKLVVSEFQSAVAAANLSGQDPVKLADKKKEVVKKSAEKVVKSNVGTTSGEKASPAIALAREISKGKSAEAVADRQKLIEQVTTGVKQNEIGKKAIQKVITEDSLTKGFDRAAKLIDRAVPNVGNSCEVEIKIQVPIGQSGAYFVTQITGSAERDKDGKGLDYDPAAKEEVNAALAVSMGAGWSAVGIDVNAQAGFFFDSSADTSSKVMGLISYGFYRKIQGISKPAAAKAWGVGGEKLTRIEGNTLTEQQAKEQKAENWAAAMEEWLFYERDSSGRIVYETDPQTGAKKPKINEDNSVKIGALGKAGAKVKAGNVGNVEAGVDYKHGTEFSASSVGEENIGKISKTPESIKKILAGAPTRTASLKVGLDIKAMEETFGVGLELALSWKPMPNADPSQPAPPPIPFSQRIVEFEVEGSGKMNTKVGGEAEWWQRVINSLGGAIALRAQKLEGSVSQKEGAKIDRASNVALILSDFESISGDAGDSIGGKLVSAVGKRTDEFEGIDDETGKLTETEIVEIKQALELAIAYSQERKAIGGDWERAIEIAVKRVKETGFEADFGPFGAAAKMESKVRLARYKYQF